MEPQKQSPGDLEPNAEGEDSLSRRQNIPWLWVGGGLILTILACIIGTMVINSLILEQPLEPSAELMPTVIVLTAPPSSTPAPTSSAPPPTAIPTFTPIPTPDTAVAPGELTIGFYAEVANTDNLGVTVRGGPSTKNVALLVAQEGSKVIILEGPEEADNFTWWHIRMDDGTEGWVVANYLEPAAAP